MPGKFLSAKPLTRRKAPFAVLPVCFFLVELFAFFFLSTVDAAAQDVLTENFFEQQGYTAQDLEERNLWPLAFGALWAMLLAALVRPLPRRGSMVVFGVLYFLAVAYAVVQTGYFLLFREMMWLSDFRYASEGSDYFSVLLSYPLGWWLGILGLMALGVVTLVFYPAEAKGALPRIAAGIVLLAAAVGAWNLPKAVFLADDEVRYAGSDYGRAQSAEAAYDNMFNAHRLYQVCGVYQTAVKDVYTHYIFRITPGYLSQQEEARGQIDGWFESRETGGENGMTGLLKDKNVILVLMESMDDWMIGEHTPTLERLMAEGIQFTRFYTPGYGGIRTFNTEFAVNTGSFLSSSGGYAFDYVTNTFDQSLANQLTEEGYHALTFHYNDPSFYSRGVFSPAMGYEDYICYADYVPEGDKSLYDDLLLFDNQELSDTFFREGKRLNFVITRSAHLSYKYNEVLSHWALKRYPEYRGMTGNEETDCALLKARLVDDFFARLMTELDKRGELENTVIIGVTDHYTYGYKNEEALFQLSGVNNALLLEKTPCFIWSPGLEAMEVDKVLSTVDLLPTMLNLLGVESEYDYVGRDAFDDSYTGWALFPNGSWIAGDVAYNSGNKTVYPLSDGAGAVTAEFKAEMAGKLQAFVRINNLILETDYYRIWEE